MGKSEKQEYYPGHEYQGLFDLMHEQHGLTLLVSEMQEIVEEVRKMDSQSATIEQPDTLQEGDYTEDLSRENFEYIIDLGGDSCDLEWMEGIGLAVYKYVLVTDDYPMEHEKKTKLSTEEFLRRAENTFKKKIMALKDMKFQVKTLEEQNEILDNLFRIGYLRSGRFGSEKFKHFTPFLFCENGVIKWSKYEEMYDDYNFPETTLEELKLI